MEFGALKQQELFLQVGTHAAGGKGYNQKGESVG